ncbi:ABC transporter ATP-binding protein [Rhodobacteraceae bacterium]|nr:ABC transporter ATP-binding protein [Paracoccaceae bacterium]
MGAIDINGLNKSFGQTQVLQDVSLAINAGEFVAVLGPSGCGKTTLLRCLAGFEQIGSGTIHVGGRAMSGPRMHMAPEDRGIGVVFQNYALWPHMTVAQNVAYGLKIAGMSRRDRHARVTHALALVEMGALAERRPADLSGGQRQRVALARCLAMQAQVVLLDEPLANLDVHLRGALEDEFAAFHARTGATMFYITHDQSEAFALADRVAVMDRGRIIQFDRPEALFRQPRCETVAGFIGEGRVIEAEDIVPIGAGRARARVLGAEVELRCAPSETRRKTARISFHPDDLDILADPHRTTASGIGADITRATYRGGYLRTQMTAGPQNRVALTMNIAAHAGIEPGQHITVTLKDGWVIPEARQATG